MAGRALLLVALAAASASSPNPVDDFNQGLAAERRGDLRAAAAWLDRAQRTVPAWVLPKLELAEVLMDEGGSPDRVLGLLAAAQRLEPKSPRLFHLEALAFLEKGSPGQAEAAERVALALRPDFPEAENTLAQALWAVGRRDEAIALWRDLADKRPSDTSARALLVDRLLDNGKGVEAEKQLRTLIAEQPRNAVWHRRLARTLAAEGLDAEAAVERGKAEALAGAPTPKRKLRRLPDSRR